MNGERGNDVVSLARYRAASQEAREKLSSEQEKLLDEVTYYILMAARAIAAHTPPKR